MAGQRPDSWEDAPTSPRHAGNADGQASSGPGPNFQTEGRSRALRIDTHPLCRAVPPLAIGIGPPGLGHGIAASWAELNTGKTTIWGPGQVGAQSPLAAATRLEMEAGTEVLGAPIHTDLSTSSMEDPLTALLVKFVKPCGTPPRGGGALCWGPRADTGTGSRWRCRRGRARRGGAGGESGPPGRPPAAPGAPTRSAAAPPPGRRRHGRTSELVRAHGNPNQRTPRLNMDSKNLTPPLFASCLEPVECWAEEPKWAISASKRVHTVPPPLPSQCFPTIILTLEHITFFPLKRRTQTGTPRPLRGTIYPQERSGVQDVGGGLDDAADHRVRHPHRATEPQGGPRGPGARGEKGPGGGPGEIKNGGDYERNEIKNILEETLFLYYAAENTGRLYYFGPTASA